MICKRDHLISRTNLLNIIENLTGAIILVDRDRRIILANAMAEQFCRQPEADLIGERAGEVLGCVNASHSPRGCGFSEACEFCTIKKTVDNTFEQKAGLAFLHAIMNLGKVGRRKLKVSTGYMFMDDSEAVLVSMEDITDSEEKERLRLENAHLNAAIETAGAVCHELNQPLMVLAGYLDLLLVDRSEADPDFNHLSKLSRQVERMTEITRSLAKINSYQTKKYTGTAQILDIASSSQGPEEVIGMCSQTLHPS